ncbi:MAG: TonB-dependent receptor plug domain-containing protein, partial [Mucilaginibacter sp.]
MKKTVLHFYTNLCPRCILVCAIFSFYASTTLAQTDTVKTLNEVNVDAGSARLPGLAPMQSISAADFLKVSAFNVADAIRNFAGVNIRDYGGIGGLKTVSVRSIGAGHTAVLYDGVQVNDAQNGQVDLGRFNLNNVQLIALYTPQPNELCMPARTFAAASVLTISTVKPNLDRFKPYQISAGIKAGSFGLVNPYLQWQQRLSDSWSFILNGQIQDADGRYKYRDPFKDGVTATRINGDIAVRQIEGALYWAKTDSNKFHIQFNINNSDRGLPGAVIQNAVYDKQRLQNNDALVQAGYQRIWDNSFKLLLNTKVSRNYQHYTDSKYLVEGGADDEYTLKEFYQSAALSYKFLKSLEVSYSTDIAVTDLNSQVYVYAFPTRVSLFN